MNNNESFLSSRLDKTTLTREHCYILLYVSSDCNLLVMTKEINKFSGKLFLTTGVGKTLQFLG